RCCAFGPAAIGLEFARGTRARRAISGDSWPSAFAQLIGRNRRRYGGYVVHAAIVLRGIGVIGWRAYDTTKEQRLRVGESLAIGGYTLTYRGATTERAANATELRPLVDVERGRDSLGTRRPGKTSSPAEGRVRKGAGIRSDRSSGEDLFLIAEQIGPRSVFLK